MARYKATLGLDDDSLKDMRIVRYSEMSLSRVMRLFLKGMALQAKSGWRISDDKLCAEIDKNPELAETRQWFREKMIGLMK